MSNMKYLHATSYTDIPDQSTNIEAVRRELEVIIKAQPTQLYPEEREGYLDALLEDIRERDDAAWRFWPPELFLQCLTAIKVLSRNPIGSTTLTTPTHIRTLIYHSALPSLGFIATASQSPFSATSPQALEAFRILANVLTLHPAARDVSANECGARTIAQALANKDANGEYNQDEDEECVDRLFLLGKCGFLLTVNRKEDVGIMVNDEEIVDSLVCHLTVTLPIPSNFQALSELLKLATNILTFYPFKSFNRDEPWDDRFDALLWPTLCLLHTIPFNELLPPLSHVINVLFHIPFHTSTIPTWQSIPEIPSPTSGSSVRNLINRLSGLSHISTSSSSTSTPLKQQSSSLTDQLVPSRSRTPSPSSLGRGAAKRTATPLLKKSDPTALVVRVLDIVDRFAGTYAAWPTVPDDMNGMDAVRFDEFLPPSLLLLSKAARGDETMRGQLKRTLLPDDLDRSAEAGPLERRPGLLGTLVRFMACTNHPQTKATAGELLWSVCGEDPSTLSAEIGYGNAAGILFQKGVTAPPPGKISEISDKAPQKFASTSLSADAVNPITGVQGVPDTKNILQSMTDEEKEREAERLFSLFDRMDKNPVISARGPDGKEQSVKDAVRHKYAEVDQTWGGKERIEREEEESREEEEVKRTMEAYKKRTGRK